jgi:hypothetical protein
MLWSALAVSILALFWLHVVDSVLAVRDRPEPLLANERHLLDDLRDLLAEKPLVKDPSLLFTTYDDIWRNVLLDVHMMYEEHLQERIDADSYFDAAALQVVQYIHKHVPMASVRGMLSVSQNASEYRASRVLWLRSNLTITDLVEDDMVCYRAVDWSRLQQRVGTINVPLAKLLKMIVSQYPYFGGSVDYIFGETESLEYWMYHLSSLTKDPDRIIPNSKLPKPIKDYRTYSGGRIPFDNQRNLGTGVTEALWADLPHKLRVTIVRLLTDQHEKSMVELYRLRRSPTYIAALRAWRQLTTPTDTDVQKLWDFLDEDGKKELYGDVLLLPWSNAHLYNGHGDWNVVGVRGNILENPSVAANRYVGDLDKAFPGTAPIPSGTFIVDDQLYGQPVSKQAAVVQFQSLHQAWYDKSWNALLPIMGGISGHTLGYLNLYADAIKSDPSHQLPVSMEVFRACMLGGLIGTKRHHSYDEVLVASVGMPDGKGANMTYWSDGFYYDIENAIDAAIRAAGAKATELLLNDIENPPVNSTLYILNWECPGWGKWIKAALNPYVRGTANLATTLEALQQMSSTGCSPASSWTTGLKSL